MNKQNNLNKHTHKSYFLFEKYKTVLVVTTSYYKTKLISTKYLVHYNQNSLSLPTNSIPYKVMPFFYNSEAAYCIQRFLISESLKIYINQNIFKYIEKKEELYFIVHDYYYYSVNPIAIHTYCKYSY